MAQGSALFIVIAAKAFLIGNLRVVNEKGSSVESVDWVKSILGNEICWTVP